MRESTALFMILGYNFAITLLACYMAVTYSPWWVLILILTQFKFEYKKDREQEN